MKEQALSMKETKEKLVKLEELIPQDFSDGMLYEFGRYLADYLNPELVPMGFVMGCELALYDLEKGVNGFTGKRIENNIVGYPPQTYSLLRMEIPRIADAVFSAEFAASVKKHIEEINAKMNAERS
ncbi:MAG: hypothetical protein UW30_C0001G0047 [Candidatus Giovannonibacteria bacterium GW2011_GWA2_44_13b]|uniref:Uncharacterized protein n=2 Tax=Candidatus Giovannoniibacteriota TaxID=1752738 RepID=A0A0G1JE74_9BACT|nr:MAG: hypothetical protein UW30_C0001G0047 [Candidatus Giovannonibacteria bacterium GW2011_GWA2_44_13b]OGF83232.1 MAG: hypothetical protein A2924_02865 [Candidatus Giovannonibacteria bacterium RIFCSPLOWO2_01_FULL_44_16]